MPRFTSRTSPPRPPTPRGSRHRPGDVGGTDGTPGESNQGTVSVTVVVRSDLPRISWTGRGEGPPLQLRVPPLPLDRSPTLPVPSLRPGRVALELVLWGGTWKRRKVSFTPTGTAGGAPQGPSFVGPGRTPRAPPANHVCVREPRLSGPRHVPTARPRSRGRGSVGP